MTTLEELVPYIVDGVRGMDTAWMIRKRAQGDDVPR